MENAVKTNHRRNYIDPGSRSHWYTLDSRTAMEWSNLARRTSERRVLKKIMDGVLDPDEAVIVGKLNWH